GRGSGVQAAFGLAEAGPAAGAGVFADGYPAGAGGAADGLVAVVGERVDQHAVLGDVGVHLVLGPGGQGVDLDHAAAGVPLDHADVAAVGGLVPADAGGPGVVRGERAGQRFDLAQRAAAVRVPVVQPWAVLGVLLGDG